MIISHNVPARLWRDEAVLVVIDMQERLIPAMRCGDGAVAEAVKLVRGFAALGCPALVTQQYTKGLGESVAELREAAAEVFGAFSFIEKAAFSAMGDPAFVAALDAAGKKHVVLCGVEAHVCVLQSALDMMEAGYSVFLATDAVSSRKERDEAPALRRLEQAGAVLSSTESILFELLDNDSKSDVFKAISKLIK